MGPGYQKKSELLVAKSWISLIDEEMVRLGDKLILDLVSAKT